jgi:hypothetical protein
MVRSVEHYPSETIVVVHAKLRKAPKRVKNATIHDYELEVYEVHKVGDLTENVPFTVYDAENINRDREDVDDDEEDEGSLFPGTSDNNTPVEGTPRASQELSRPARIASPAPGAKKSQERKSQDASRTSALISRSEYKFRLRGSS